MRQHRGSRFLIERVLSVGIATALAMVIALSSAAATQKAPQPPVKESPPTEAEPTPNQAPAPPGYEADLLRLSEVMGALSFLRTLCGAADAPQWYGRMSALIDSEARDAETRARLAGAFNQGYNGFSITYRTCTPAAKLSVNRYLEEGERLSRVISARFGG